MGIIFRELKILTRRPATSAYYPPSNFLKDAFQKDEKVFYSKNGLHIFPNFKNFLICAKKPTIQVEKGLL